MRRSVVLPQPLGPSSEMSWPSSKSKLASSSATTGSAEREVSSLAAKHLAHISDACRRPCAANGPLVAGRAAPILAWLSAGPVTRQICHARTPRTAGQRLNVSGEISYDIYDVNFGAVRLKERACDAETSDAGRDCGGAVDAWCRIPAAQAQDRDVKFVLDFISLGRHAPWYVALGKGYFKEEGLNVTILPSKGTADAIRTVVTRRGRIRLHRHSEPRRRGRRRRADQIVAANYQKPPYCIFSLNPGANIDSAKKLTGLELGSSSASFLPRIWAAVMEMNGVDSKTMKVVNIDAPARVPMLAARKVPSIDLFIMSEPAIRRAVPDAKPVCLFAGDLGLEIYANSIGVHEDFLKANPGCGEEIRACGPARLEGHFRRSAGSGEDPASICQGARSADHRGGNRDPEAASRSRRRCKRTVSAPSRSSG